jgi:hypothetical protein
MEQEDEKCCIARMILGRAAEIKGVSQLANAG